jgi:hypothetical protein
MPDDGIKVVKANSTTDDRNIRMERKHEMPTEIAPRNTDVPYDTNQAPAWNKYPEDVSPDFLQLRKKCFVILNVAELIRVFIVTLEVPIWRRCNNKVKRLRLQERQFPCITID